MYVYVCCTRRVARAPYHITVYLIINHKPVFSFLFPLCGHNTTKVVVNCIRMIHVPADYGDMDMDEDEFKGFRREVADCLLDGSGIMGVENCLEYCDTQIKEALGVLAQAGAAGPEATHGALVLLEAAQTQALRLVVVQTQAMMLLLLQSWIVF